MRKKSLSMDGASIITPAGGAYKQMSVQAQCPKLLNVQVQRPGPRQHGEYDRRQLCCMLKSSRAFKFATWLLICKDTGGANSVT